MCIYTCISICIFKYIYIDRKKHVYQERTLSPQVRAGCSADRAVDRSSQLRPGPRARPPCLHRQPAHPCPGTRLGSKCETSRNLRHSLPHKSVPGNRTDQSEIQTGLQSSFKICTRMDVSPANGVSAFFTPYELVQLLLAPPKKHVVPGNLAVCVVKNVSHCFEWQIRPNLILCIQEDIVTWGGVL